MELGRSGGKARARKLTPEQRREAVRKALQARWAKQRELTREISEGNRNLLRAFEANTRKAREIEIC